MRGNETRVDLQKLLDVSQNSSPLLLVTEGGEPHGAASEIHKQPLGVEVGFHCRLGVGVESNMSTSYH